MDPLLMTLKRFNTTLTVTFHLFAKLSMDLYRYLCVAMQLQVRSMVVEYVQRSLIDSGFFPSSSLNDQCAQHVLGHNSLREAKKNMGKFTAVTKMVIVCIQVAQ